MEVIIRPDSGSAAHLAAELLAGAIKAKPHTVLGLATGRTMEDVYAKLVNKHQQENLDFSLCRTYNLDEYIGLSPDDKNSYRHYMNHHLFSHINIDPRNTHLPLGNTEDVEEECAKYEQSIRYCGGIDLQLLGLGCAGHIGFNEPLSALRSRTRAKALTPTTIEQNAPLFDKPENMPKRAITMGVGTILEAKRIIMLVAGEEKADILAKAVEGPVTAMVSASALQLHSKCTVVVDEAAGTLLQGKDYYRWIFENEPEWQKYQDI